MHRFEEMQYISQLKYRTHRIRVDSVFYSLEFAGQVLYVKWVLFSTNFAMILGTAIEIAATSVSSS